MLHELRIDDSMSIVLDRRLFVGCGGCRFENFTTPLRSLRCVRPASRLRAAHRGANPFIPTATKSPMAWQKQRFAHAWPRHARRPTIFSDLDSRRWRSAYRIFRNRISAQSQFTNVLRRQRLNPKPHDLAITLVRKGGCSVLASEFSGILRRRKMDENLFRSVVSTCHPIANPPTIGNRPATHSLAFRTQPLHGNSEALATYKTSAAVANRLRTRWDSSHSERTIGRNASEAFSLNCP